MWIPDPPKDVARFVHSAQKSADPSSGGKAFWDGLRQRFMANKDVRG